MNGQAPRISGGAELCGIGAGAAAAGVTERALRYYQQMGLLTPSGCTPGGLRRYAERDIARVRRIRELQELLGFDLDEIRAVLANEDRLEQLREEYHASPAGSQQRQELIREGLAIRADLIATVQGKIDRLAAFRDQLAERSAHIRSLLAADEGVPG